jgi:hypothetical protein
MEFWRSNMPKGDVPSFRLRMASLDPLNVHTIDHYLETRRLKRGELEPLPISFYLEYARWFQTNKQLVSEPSYVDRLDYDNGRRGGSNRCFIAHLANGNTIIADNVVLAVGFKYFKNLPPELTSLIPSGRFPPSIPAIPQTLKNSQPSAA